MSAQSAPRRGLGLVLRFNFGWYLAALLIAAGLGCAASLSTGPWVWLWTTAAVVALWFTLASLIATHLAYDASGLCDGRWLAERLPASAQRVLVVHSGLDLSGPALARAGLPAPRVLRIVDPAVEATVSNRRALARGADPGEAVGLSGWPSPEQAADLALAITALHELRQHDQRVAVLQAIRHQLQPTARLILVEHGRDLANLLAFGPGAGHFFSEASWRRAWQAAGWRLETRWRCSPWIRAWCLRSE